MDVTHIVIIVAVTVVVIFVIYNNYNNVLLSLPPNENRKESPKTAYEKTYEIKENNKAHLFNDKHFNKLSETDLQKYGTPILTKSIVRPIVVGRSDNVSRANVVHSMSNYTTKEDIKKYPFLGPYASKEELSYLRQNRVDKIIFQATLYSSGVITCDADLGSSTEIINIGQDSLKKIIELKNKITEEDPHCCPDHNHARSGTSYLHLYDTNNTYTTIGSCMVITMKAYYELNELLKQLIVPDIYWI
jgi:hypothetical protein